MAALNEMRSFEMPTLVTQEALASIVQNPDIMLNGEISCVEGIKYDFRIGETFLKAYFERPVSFDKLTESERAFAKIEPGEVVFVLTKERIKLPIDLSIILSPKRSISHQGISVLGGLCVDPKYEGYLLIGLYNFSSEAFRLEPGRKVIAGLFYRLSAEEGTENLPLPKKVEDFPDELVRFIKAYSPVSAAALQEKLAGLSSQLMELKESVLSDQERRKEINDTLVSATKKLDTLVDALGKEREERIAEDRKVTDKLKENEKELRDIFKKAVEFGADRKWTDRFVWLLVGAALLALLRYSWPAIKSIIE